MMKLRDRVLLLALGGVFLVLGIFTMSSIIEERRFVNGDFIQWIQTDATIDDYQVSIDSREPSRKEYIYTLRYDYTVNFETSEGWVRIHNSIESQEKRASPDLTTDSFAPMIIGEVNPLSFNPDDPEDYRWGSKDDITKAASNPMRILICAVFIVGSVLLIWLAIRPFIKKKEKLAWHETDDNKLHEEKD